jgi:hypothetical protein
MGSTVSCSAEGFSKLGLNDFLPGLLDSGVNFGGALGALAGCAVTGLAGDLWEARAEDAVFISGLPLEFRIGTNCLLFEVALFIPEAREVLDYVVEAPFILAFGFLGDPLGEAAYVDPNPFATFAGILPIYAPLARSILFIAGFNYL